MRRHPGLGPEHSGSKDFWSDANMNARAVPASATDFALTPGEDPQKALANSLSLQQVQSMGGELPMLALQEIEVDEGFRSMDLSEDYLDAQYPTNPQQHSAPIQHDESAMADRIAAMVMQRINQSLGGN